MSPERRGPPPQHYNYIEHPSSLAMPWHIIDRLYGHLPDANDLSNHEGTHAQHFINGRKVITQAAREAAATAPGGLPKKALILGSGYCLDIPLEELTASFDAITLIDILPQRTRRAVEKLTPHQQAKITIIRADITGKNAQVLSGLESAQPNGRAELYKFVRGTQATFTQALDETPADLGTGYDFVSSHMVMSQLDSIWLTYMADLYNKAEVTPTDPFDFSKTDAFKKAIATMKRAKREHVALLHRAVSDTGLVHFADGTFGPNQEFTHLANPLFTLVQTDEWKWPNLQGRVWDVQSFSLRPKPQKV